MEKLTVAQKKEFEKQQRYWNELITRKEAKGFCEAYLSKVLNEVVDNHLKTELGRYMVAMNINMIAVRDILIEKGICTKEDFMDRVASIMQDPEGNSIHLSGEQGVNEVGE